MTKYIAAALIGCLLAVIIIYIQPRFKIQNRKPHTIVAAKSYPGSFQVSIVSDQTLPIAPGNPFTLTATVFMTNGSGEFEFLWLLPEGVNVISGNEEPALTFNSSGRAETQITLSLSQSNINYQIHGEAYRYVTVPEEGYLGATAQFNSNPNLLDKVALPILKKHRVIH